MGTTTLSIDEDVKERLDAYKLPGYENWSEALDGLMNLVPEPGDMVCTRHECDREARLAEDRQDTAAGVIQHFSYESGGERWFQANWFCSPECAHRFDQDARAHYPEEPDTVVVGGFAMPRAEIEGATFYMDGETREVGIDAPGAFAGVDSHGDEYDYEGEPVYIRHQGKYVQTGTIGNIVHEDAHTGLLLDWGPADVVYLNHPDVDEQEEWMAEQDDVLMVECPECHARFSIPPYAESEECEACGEVVVFDVLADV